MYAACFGMYLGHAQVCQYKERIPEGTIKIQWVATDIYCIMLCMFFFIDVPEDGQSTCRNMQHICGGNTVD